MAIKARFVEGVTSATTKSLYQWDYGQQLEIESADLPATFEVHFACSNMKEAAVVPCSAVDGVGVVTIPNKCLEQSSDITAWVYEINGETGSTTKTISIPVVQRVRPSCGEEIPQHIVDKYAELITLVNAAIAELKNGEVIVSKAENAANADYAKSAGNASSASYAADANNANRANRANFAGELRGNGSFHKSFEGNYTTEVTVTDPGWYVITTINYSNTLATELIRISDLKLDAYSCGRECYYMASQQRIILSRETGNASGIKEILGISFDNTMGV